MKSTLFAAALLSAVAPLALPATGLAAGAGTLDPTFGNAGQRTYTGFGNPVAALSQPDGKTLLLTGNQYTALDGFVVVRLTVDGALDRTFDGDGIASVSVAGSDVPAALALQPDGKIVVAGSSGPTMAVARFTDAGKLDPTFSPASPQGPGRVLINGYRQATAVSIEPDGHIDLASGLYGTGQDASVLRLTPEGDIATTQFEVADLGGADDRAVALADDQARGLTLLGRASIKGRYVAVIARYGTNRRLTGGAVVKEIETPKSVHVPPDGSVVVTGLTDGSDPATVAVRLTPGNLPDPSFGTGGVAQIDFPGQDVFAGSALTAAGKLVVAGSGYSSTDFDAVRLTATGTPDATFGDGGTAVHRVTETFGNALAATLASDGRLVIAGVTIEPGPIARPTAIRLASDPAPATPPDPTPAPTPAPPASGQPQSDTGPEPQPSVDATAPVLAHLKVVGRTVRADLSEAASVRLRLERVGRGGKRRSVKGSAQTVAGRPGALRVRLRARLAPGRYRLLVTATDAAGNTSRTRFLTFSIHRSRA